MQGGVVARRRQAAAKAVVAGRPVQPVEPVTRVVAVAVHRLAAQQVLPRMEVGHALAQGHQRQPQHLHPGPLGGRRGQRQLEGVDVPQRVVVVVLGVVHHLGRLAGVARGLVAVADLLARLHLPAAGGEAVAAQAAGQAQAHQVGAGQQRVGRRAAAGRQHLIGRTHQAVEPALLLHDGVGPVARAAAAQRIAQAVIEGADAAAVQ